MADPRPFRPRRVAKAGPRGGRRPAFGPGRRTQLVAAAILVVSLFAAVIVARRASPDPARSLAAARSALAAGNYSGARDQALVAAKATPDDPAAQLALAHAYVELGDGLAADAVVTRAQSLGVPPARLHALRAAARLLQGDLDSALAEAGLADPADRIDATRVRAQVLAAQGDAAGARQLLLGARDAGSLADLGRTRFDVGDIGGAANAATAAIAADPRSPAALTLQAEVIRSRYGLVAALPWFEEALKHDRAYPPALIEYAATLGDAGRNREALAAARRALTARPGSTQPLFLMAVLAARAGNMDLAKAMLGHAGDALDDLPATLLLSGAIDQAQGHAELAVSQWGQLLDRQLDNRVVRRLLAAALLRSGDARGALDTVGPIVARGDADSYALELAARAAWLVGDRPGAAGFHDRAITAGRGGAASFAPANTVATLRIDAADAPGDAGRALALIRGLIAGGEVAEALDGARGLATAMPGNAAAQLVLADALALAGRAAEATTPYARAADLSFDEPTMLKLVDTLGRLGRGPEGAKALALYLSQNPQSITALRIAGHWQVQGGDPRHAITTLERVRRAVGNRDAGLLADLALAYGASGRSEAARRYARAAYALAPMNIDVVTAYAAVLARLGDADGAGQLRAKAQALSKSG